MRERRHTMETQLSDSMHQMFTELHIYPSSVTQHRELTYALGEPKLGTRRLVILAPSASTALEQFTGEASVVGGETLLIGPLEHHNATALRSQLSWLNPVTLGLRTSAGLGDRLGIATPGHLRAVREAGGHIAPIPAQQSIREMIRTGEAHNRSSTTPCGASLPRAGVLALPRMLITSSPLKILTAVWRLATPSIPLTLGSMSITPQIQRRALCCKISSKRSPGPPWKIPLRSCWRGIMLLRILRDTCSSSMEKPSCGPASSMGALLRMWPGSIAILRALPRGMPGRWKSP